ncbi:NAD(P)-binding domain-containing protein [Sphingomonas sp. G124]|uniref:NAD(P)-binding domain-containing protein n=1 Tax=Sphingomonas cremea TaxID=2904799 RepID=A0A9X1QKV2_9SPHN|nr:NAD(P)-binding domain-containing protein [Sphingomonas cremea]MCF2515536.1 NAD(P)-binding domain-containing protein [Sphingomonas cremea]
MTLPTGWLPEIGVIGTGRMGTRLAAMFARAGRRVILGSRDPRRAEAIVEALGVPRLHAGTYEDAASAPAVLPALFLRDELIQHLEALRGHLSGKLLIDISNPFNDDYSDFLTPWDGSSAELLQQQFPEARIVGAFKNVWSEVFDRPLFDGVTSDVLVTGDDELAKQAFLNLAADTPFRYLDAGPLRNSRTVERLTLLTGRLGRQLDIYPTMNWRLLGQTVKAA